MIRAGDQSFLPEIPGFKRLASLMAHAYGTPDQIAAALAASGLNPAAQSIASGYVYYVGAQYALALPAWQKELAANPSDVRAAISHKHGHAALAEKLDKEVATYKF
jgi:hypothetical protein